MLWMVILAYYGWKYKYIKYKHRRNDMECPFSLFCLLMPAAFLTFFNII